MNDKIKGLISFALFVGMVSLTCGIILTCFGYHYISHPKNAPISRANTFRYIETNSVQKDYRIGFAELPQTILEEEYLNFKSEVTGNYFFISKLGGNTYECTGSCYCTSNDERRIMSASILSRGVYVVLSALSILTAHKIAKETFKENCILHFSEICDPNDITSEVSTCDGIKTPTVDEVMKPGNVGGVETMNPGHTEEEERIVGDDDDDLPIRQYDCNGHCSPNYDIEESKLVEYVESLGPRGCGEIGITGQIDSVESEDLFGQYSKVQGMFTEQYLDPFCESRSKSEDGNFCVGVESEVKCRRNGEVSKEYKQMFRKGREYLIDEVNEFWDNWYERFLREGQKSIEIRYKDVYYIQVRVWDYGRDSDCPGCRFLGIDDIQTSEEYRSMGLFEGILDDLEEWVSNRFDVDGVCIHAVVNDHFGRFFTKRGYKKSEILKLNHFYKRL